MEISKLLLHKFFNCIIPSNKQQPTAFFMFDPASRPLFSRFPPSPAPVPPSSRPSVPLHSTATGSNDSLFVLRPLYNAIRVRKPPAPSSWMNAYSNKSELSRLLQAHNSRLSLGLFIRAKQRRLSITALRRGKFMLSRSKTP